ncbi:MAG: 2-hydroxychromene-2-carboxylate isomerase, partial [Deltaproteobacteria bacterium]|nr:2-hydroxychromene-2-carboxylate isomerase [Deltaproteobacteria bacterium]
MTAKTVEYFYDLSSPYAYLAHEAIEPLAAAHGAQVRWRPFLLGSLFKALGGPIVPIAVAPPAKQAIFRADILRWAEVRELPMQWPSQFPMNTVRPLRVLCQLEGAAHTELAKHLFKQYWAHDRNIGDAATLQAILDEQGLDGAALLAGCERPEVKAALIAATEEAVQRGACGAPTFFVGDHLVWGQDR